MPKVLRIAVVLVLLASDAVMCVGPFLWKSEGNGPGIVWLFAAGVVLVGSVVRLVLNHRPGSRAEPWVDALRPAVFGAVVALATVAFIVLVLPLVVFLNR